MKAIESLVSIVVPVYNVEKYLKECLESIIQQDYRNLEIIVVDDGSPDNSGKIADEYAEADKRIKVIHKENAGVVAARNTGMDLANGEFILFVDSDDWLSKDHVSHLLKLQKIKDADMCMTTKFFTQKSDVQTQNIKIETISPCDAATLLISPKMVIGTYNKLYRLDWLKKEKLRQNEELFSGEGLHFIVLAAQHANYITISNKKIYYYRRNVAESATTKFNIKMFTNNEKSLDSIEKNSIITDENFINMLNLFRIHLKISGMLAILTYASKEDYKEEYIRWRKEIKQLGKKLLFKKELPIKSKIRIVCATICPSGWAKLAKIKRDKQFRESV